jgi:hypothetical protein
VRRSWLVPLAFGAAAAAAVGVAGAGWKNAAIVGAPVVALGLLGEKLRALQKELG